MNSKTIILLAVMLALRCSGQNYDTNGDFVQTFAGSGEVGLINGQGLLTIFNNPYLIVSDVSSNLYVWDAGNSVVRKITPNGTVTTFAGGGADVEGFHSFKVKSASTTTFVFGLEPS